MTLRLALGAVYEVGPGRTYATIGSVPWNTLVADDHVVIHPGVYREKIDITRRGTAGHPIVIEGAPDASGNLPIIEADGATTGPNYSPGRVWQYGPGLGLVYFGVKEGHAGELPGYVTLRKLRIQGAKAGVTYTDKDGAAHVMGRHSAIYLQTSENVVLEGLEITDNDQGVFGNSNSGAVPAVVTRDLTIRGCKIWGNGRTDSFLVHNAYIEAAGVVYEHNYFGPPRRGAKGNNIKDRSAGTVIRYNTIHNGAHLLDLVETQEGAGYILDLPSYRETWVYGNVFLNTQYDPGGGAQGAGNLIHYGAEYQNARAGTLYFHGNYVLQQWNQAFGTGPKYRSIMFQLSDNIGTVDMKGNLFVNQPWDVGKTRTQWFWKGDSPVTKASWGNLTFGPNFVSPGGWGVYYTLPTGGAVVGMENLIPFAMPIP